MERKDEVAVTRFFKVMMSNFEHKLKLPPPISKELWREKSRRATLQSRLGTWEISLCNHSENDELICLNEGWSQFVDRHALSSGDFVFFVHSGDLHFHVYVFDPTACEKEFIDEPMKEKGALIPTGNSSRGQMGEDQISIRTKFIRIMLTGFRKRLKVPPAYCKKAIKHEKSKRAILESCKGKWDVKVCRDDDGKIILKNGWPRFAREHGLSSGDLLVFEHTGNLHFNVVVCNSTGCEKQFLVESAYDNDNDNDEHPTINPKNSVPFFRHTMTHYSAFDRKGQVTIPQEFVKPNNLEKKKGAILKDPQSGRKWRVKLCVRTSPYFNMTMSGRWPHFAEAKKFKVGDVCTFQLNPSKSATSENIYFDVSISRNTNR